MSNHVHTDRVLPCLLQGRIRGTYGINAKPVEVQTPTESPPAPGVTRASLRPKPVAKASPDDEQSEGAKPTAAAAMRHARAASSGPDAGGAAPESPGSPQHSKGSVPEGERWSEPLILFMWYQSKLFTVFIMVCMR